MIAFGFAPGLFELLIIGLIGAAAVGIPATVLVVMYVNNQKATGRKPGYGRIPCPECGESIVAEAIKCRFCGISLIDESPET